MSDPTAAPDRPIAGTLKPLRSVVRALRVHRVNLMSGRKMHVGRNFAIGGGGQVLCPTFFRAGDDVHIGRDFLCEVDVTMGDGVLVSSRVCFIGDDHEIPPAGESLFFAGRRPAQHVRLEGDNLIGNGTIVLGNVTIGRGAVVGAGSLVLADVPPHAIVVGRPARLVRYRLGGGPGESAPPAPGEAAATRAG
jgi:acetyltransferase-like isoleucine patch superfamily enzyme